MTEPVTANSSARTNAPADAGERLRALDPERSFLVQAPAGSGKTSLLAMRFLRLLARVERPEEIVAITFTVAAAAEMRSRVLGAIESARSPDAAKAGDGAPGNRAEMAALARPVLERSERLGWRLLELPGRLRITTIDAFCRGLAVQGPLSWGPLSGLGGTLNLADPQEAYRLAARRTLELLSGAATPERASVEALLRWRDNNWRDIEYLIVQMLGQRSRWFQGFVFERGVDWEALRRRLEAPFLRAARRRLVALCRMLDGLEGCREYALELARLACQNGGKSVPLSLAERAGLPVELPEPGSEAEAPLVEEAVAAYRDLAAFLLTATGGTWRKKSGLNLHQGFPATPAGKKAKERFGDFVEGLALEPGLEAALAAFLKGMPVGYEEAEWELIRHCFAVLRTAYAQLQLVFAETGEVDFTEVARMALNVLAPEGGFASEVAQRQAGQIRHLLVDEFQDTSRNQHELLSRLIAAWPEREGRSCFCVGDPMQSIYGFREAEVELFERLKTHGLEAASSGNDGYLDAEPFRFEFVRLEANFRTEPSLVEDLNGRFARIFDDGGAPDAGGVRFAPAVAAREAKSAAKTELHLAFTRSGAEDEGGAESDAATRAAQLTEVVALIREMLAAARARGESRYRVAVLARARTSLTPVAEALRAAGIRYRALDLVKLNERPEVLDALALARALVNPMDRTAWLSVLRAPWCGLTLAELHRLTSADERAVCSTAVPLLLETRLPQLHAEGQLGGRAFRAADRVSRVLRQAQAERAAANRTLGTWLESVWRGLGGADTVDPAQHENLRALWAALDKLSDGELDLLGPGLAAALGGLYALPDPESSGEFGVQLMTIHKAKGLEFEAVLVPGLEARGKTGEHGMMSWLERGLAGPSSGGEVSEFLIAPIKTKGGDASAAKRWVDAVKQERERMELRRLIYVAATRARDELHLFARPAYRVNDAGEPSLAAPSGLLKTVWPAFGDEVEARFAGWLGQFQTQFQSQSQPQFEAIALAAAAANVVEMPAAAARPERPALLRRLPEGYLPPPAANRTDERPTQAIQALRNGELGDGGLAARLLGTAIHSLLEDFSRLRQSLSAAGAAQELGAAMPPVRAALRGGGLSPAEAARLAEEALAVARRAAADPVGAWILGPHPISEAEIAWTGAMGDGGRRRIARRRPDRVFFDLASEPVCEPGTAGSGVARDPVWWIVDYKTTAAAGASLEAAAERQRFLTAQRGRYAEQLAAYAAALRGLRGVAALPIRVGLYYPRLGLGDFWEA